MRRRRRRIGLRVAAGALAIGLALAGCSESGNSGSSGAAPANRGAAAPAAGAAGAPNAGAAGPAATATAGGTDTTKPGSKPQVAGHSVIYAGELQLRCDHVDAALAQAEAIVATAGGYVDSENSGTDGTPVPLGGDGSAQPLPAPTGTGGETAVAVFKVPTANYDAVYQQLAALGTVLGRERSSQDVTAQVVDLTSRIKTQQASIDRINALMKQATSLNDIITIEAALTQRESDLESMESQLSALQSQVAMSTVTVQLFQQAKPVVVAKPKPPTGAWGAAWKAMKAGWHGLYLVFRTVLVVVSALVPFLIILVPVAALVWWLNRRRRKGDPGAGAEPGPAPGFAPPKPPAPGADDSALQSAPPVPPPPTAPPTPRGPGMHR